jgi:hypothetical protein
LLSTFDARAANAVFGSTAAAELAGPPELAEATPDAAGAEEAAVGAEEAAVGAEEAAVGADDEDVVTDVDDDGLVVLAVLLDEQAVPATRRTAAMHAVRASTVRFMCTPLVRVQ